MMRAAVAALTIGALGLTAATCDRIYVPPEALLGPVDGLVEVNKRMSGALDEVLSTYRTNARLMAFRSMITETVLVEGQTFALEAQTMLVQAARERDAPEGYSQSRPLERLFLCEPRQAYSGSRGHQTFIAAFVAASEELVAAPSAEIPANLRSIVTDWSRRFPVASAVPADMRSGCMEDLETFPNIVYPDAAQARPESSLVAVAAALELAEVVYDVFKPILTAGLQEVDRAKRAAALQQWLRTKGNVERLKTALIDGRRRIVAMQMVARAEAVAGFIRSLRAFETGSGAWQRSNEVLRSAACQAARQPQALTPAQRGEIKKRAEFQSCYAALIEVWRPSLEEMLLRASDYDRQADGRLDRAADQFVDRLQALESLVNGKIDLTSKEGKDIIAAYYTTAVRITAWVETIKETADDEKSSKKIRDVVERLLKNIRA